jgi:hypothetical protein
MNFDLTEEQQMVRNAVREYAQNEIAPVAREYDEAEKFPRKQLEGLAELGLLGMIIPEEYGGAGFDSVSYAVALEEISQADSSVAVIVSVTNSVCCYPILVSERKSKNVNISFRWRKAKSSERFVYPSRKPVPTRPIRKPVPSRTAIFTFSTAPNPG